MAGQWNYGYRALVAKFWTKGKISCIRREAIVAYKLVRHTRTINLRNNFPLQNQVMSLIECFKKKKNES